VAGQAPRRHHPIAHACLQPFVFSIDIIDFEIEDHGTIGPRFGDAFAVCLSQRLLNYG